MRRQLGVRIALVVVVIAVSIWYLYPPAKTINLGLDLQGGIHLVLGVDVDKAIEAQVERAGDTAKAELEKRGIGVTRVERRGTTELVIQLASPQSWDAAVKATDEVLATFDRKEADQAAGRMVLALKPREAAHIRELAVRQGLETIRNRIDQFGVAEPSIQQQGENRILVQLPGRAGSGAGQGPHRQDRAARVQAGRRAHRPGEPRCGPARRPAAEILYQRRVDKQTREERKVPFLVQKKAAITGGT